MKSALGEQLLHECKAMARFALSTGLKIPGKLIQDLEAVSAQEPSYGVKWAERTKGEVPEQGENSEGTPPTPSPRTDIQQLTKIHGRLAEIVAPATPRSILAIQSTKRGIPSLISRMMLAAGVSFALLIGAISLKFLESESGTPGGWTELVDQLRYLAAAGLGASFFSLFKANRYVVNGTFDPTFETTYWVRFSLGLIAGTMLANLEIGTGDFAKPTLAALGGFSADAVQRILTRLVDALSSLVRGETGEILAAQQQAMKARLAEQAGQQRLKMASNLIGLQRKVGAEAHEELRQKLEHMIDDLIVMDKEEEAKEAKEVSAVSSGAAVATVKESPPAKAPVGSPDR
jgi:hypothetical protein